MNFRLTDRVVTGFRPGSDRVLSALESTDDRVYRVYQSQNKGGTGIERIDHATVPPPYIRKKPGQTRSPGHPSRMQNAPKRAKTDHRAAYDAQNAEAARLILADPERYGGPDSLAIRWARLVADRHKPKQEQPSLFETREVIYANC